MQSPPLDANILPSTLSPVEIFAPDWPANCPNLPGARNQTRSLGVAMVQNKLKLSEDHIRNRLSCQPRRSDRRERRSPLCVLLRILGFSTCGRIFSEFTRTTNISPSGCCVRLRTRPLADTTLALHVVSREDTASYYGAPLLYHVAWLRQQDQEWEIGLSALRDADLLQVAFASRTP
jgi:hypothetical protein